MSPEELLALIDTNPVGWWDRLNISNAAMELLSKDPRLSPPEVAITHAAFSYCISLQEIVREQQKQIDRLSELIIK